MQLQVILVILLYLGVPRVHSQDGINIDDGSGSFGIGENELVVKLTQLLETNLAYKRKLDSDIDDIKFRLDNNENKLTKELENMGNEIKETKEHLRQMKADFATSKTEIFEIRKEHHKNDSTALLHDTILNDHKLLEFETKTLENITGLANELRISKEQFEDPYGFRNQSMNWQSTIENGLLKVTRQVTQLQTELSTFQNRSLDKQEKVDIELRTTNEYLNDIKAHRSQSAVLQRVVTFELNRIKDNLTKLQTDFTTLSNSSLNSVNEFVMELRGEFVNKHRELERQLQQMNSSLARKGTSN